jgi:hypothetical protein
MGSDTTTQSTLKLASTSGHQSLGFDFEVI